MMKGNALMHVYPHSMHQPTTFLHIPTNQTAQLPHLLPLFPPTTLPTVFLPLCFALLEDPVAAVRARTFPVRAHALAYVFVWRMYGSMCLRCVSGKKMC